MAPKSAKDVNLTDASHREVGQRLLEEDRGPSSAAAHLYRGEIHRMIDNEGSAGIRLDIAILLTLAEVVSANIDRFGVEV